MITFLTGNALYSPFHLRLYCIDITYKPGKIINMHNKNDRNKEINIHVYTYMQTHAHKHNIQNITLANNKKLLQWLLPLMIYFD